MRIKIVETNTKEYKIKEDCLSIEAIGDKIKVTDRTKITEYLFDKHNIYLIGDNNNLMLLESPLSLKKTEEEQTERFNEWREERWVAAPPLETPQESKGFLYDRFGITWFVKESEDRVYT